MGFEEGFEITALSWGLYEALLSYRGEKVVCHHTLPCAITEVGVGGGA